jgi:hypothetical protein
MWSSTVRYITSDHVLFDDSIRALRDLVGGPDLPASRQTTKTGYMLVDFELCEPIQTAHFEIGKTRQLFFAAKTPTPWRAFIAPVTFHWAGDATTVHHWVLGVAALTSLALARPVRTTRSPVKRPIDNNPATELSIALQFPVLGVGPGAHEYFLAQDTVAEYQNALRLVDDLAFRLPETNYGVFLRAARLVQLAHNCVRDDFGLGYYLLVSAIELVAKHVVPRPSPKHANEEAWKVASEKDKLFRELYTAFKHERSKSQYIRQRFVEFVQQYCPPETWCELDHPSANMEAYIKQVFPGRRGHQVTRRRHDEVYPEHLSREEIKKVIEDLYVHRSGYTHEGLQPPHRDPDSSRRFFDTVSVLHKSGQHYVQILLPTFRLVSFIAQRSVLVYGKLLCPPAVGDKP